MPGPDIEPPFDSAGWGVTGPRQPPESARWNQVVWAAIDGTNRIQGLYWTEADAREAHPECVDYEAMIVERRR